MSQLLDDRQTLPDAQLRQMLLGTIGFERTDLFEISDRVPESVLFSMGKMRQLLDELIADGEIVSDRDPDSPMPAFRRVNRFGDAP